jgi:preprotein translocase subunit SecB
MSEQQTGDLQDMPTFLVHLQFLKDLSFENPNPLGYVIDQSSDKPDLNLNVQVNARLMTGGMFEVVLEINVDAKLRGEIMFICQIQYAAVVSLRVDQSDDENARKILLEDCPQVLFPFARDIIAHTTMNSGFQPLLLQPVDFSKLNKEQSKDSDSQEPVSEQVH